MILKRILRYNQEEIIKSEALLSEESNIVIELDGKVISVVSASNNNLDELYFGHLFLVGLIESKDDILSYNIKDNILRGNLKDKSRLKSFIENKIRSSSCSGLSIQSERKIDNYKRSNIKIDYQNLCKNMKEFSSSSDEFAKTGGVHSAGLYDVEKNKILYIYHDVSRHSAVEKVIGRIIRNNYQVSSKVIFTTGRISEDIVRKCIITAIMGLSSKSAPTVQAFNLAEHYNFFLAGFVRGSKMNIYVT